MKIPKGLSYVDGKVYKLNKSIYGLKQAARCWIETFVNVLNPMGFSNSAVDRCIYLLDHGDILKNIYVLLYVDDLVIATKSDDTITNFKTFLMSKFRMTDLCEIKKFIGIKVERKDGYLYLSQPAYINNILKKFNMEECHAVSTSLPTKLNYEALNSDEECNAPCRNLIGCLMYLMLCTYPEISTATNISRRYTNKNNSELGQNLKSV